MVADFTLIDDTSPTIAYTGSWSLGGTTNEYSNSTHGTTTSGSQATIKFTGSSVDVYGTIGRENNGDASFASVSSYTVDADPNSTAVFTATPGDVVLYRQPLYTSPTLASEEQHTLVITYLAADKSPLWLDYVRIRREANAQSPPSSPPSSSSTGFSSIPSRDSLQPTSPPRPPDLSKGVIVGIAIGSFVAFCLLVAIIIISRRLPNPSNGTGSKSVESHARWPWRSSPPTGITPFDAAAPTSQRPMNTDPSVLLPHQASGFGSGSGSSPPPTGYVAHGGTYKGKMRPNVYPPVLYHQASTLE